jgi:hypothetical protein
MIVSTGFWRADADPSTALRISGLSVRRPAVRRTSEQILVTFRQNFTLFDFPLPPHSLRPSSLRQRPNITSTSLACVSPSYGEAALGPVRNEQDFRQEVEQQQPTNLSLPYARGFLKEGAACDIVRGTRTSAHNAGLRCRAVGPHAAAGRASDQFLCARLRAGV